MVDIENSRMIICDAVEASLIYILSVVLAKLVESHPMAIGFEFAHRGPRRKRRGPLRKDSVALCCHLGVAIEARPGDRVFFLCGQGL